MSYRPKIKADSNGTLQDLPLDAETVQGKTPVFTTTDQTISGVKTYTDTQIFKANLTGQYIIGTWFQTTKTTDLGSAPPKYGVIDSNGWIYTRTLDETKTDLGINGKLDATYFGSEMELLCDDPITFFQDYTSDYNVHKQEWTNFISDLVLLNGNQSYYLHTIRAYQSSSPLSSVVFSVISTKSTAYTKSTLYNDFQNKVFHASGFCGSFVKADGRINYVYLDSATTIKMYHGNNTGTSQTYGGSYFADEVKRIA